MKKRWIALLMALSVLASSGCGLTAQTEDGPEPSEETEQLLRPNVTIHAMSGQEDPEPSEQEPEEIPEEPEEIKLTWCTDPVLTEEEMPGSYRGLELPVEGATGYTSTVLPLWASLEDWKTFQQAVYDWQQYQAAAAAAAAAQESAPDGQPQSENDGSAAPAPDGQPPSGDGESTAPPPDDQPLSENGGGALSALVDRIRSLSAQEDSGAGEEPSLPPEDIEDSPLPEDELPPSPEEAPQETEASFPPFEGETAPLPEGEPSQASVEAGPAAPETAESAEPPEPVLPGQEEAVPPEMEEPLDEPALTDAALAVLPAGTAMTVLREEGDWWQISCKAEYFTRDGGTTVGEVVGWVAHRYCMINLPDVIPSIVYNATNAYSSVFRTCGKEIDGITGVQLYSGPASNQRLGQVEFMMPVLYSMAPRLCAAQQAALREGNTLVLYEGYRPKETQLKVARAVQAMMNKEPEIRTALNTKPWSIPWFIATSTSNHQWGYAVDVSLARVSSVGVYQTGHYAFTRVTEYEEYEMPTPIHELSPAAAIFKQAIGPNSKTAWKSAAQTESFAASESALGLQGYCTGAGLSPLASEWWHFNDLDSRAGVLDNLGKGDFEITVCRSEVPW